MTANVSAVIPDSVFAALHATRLGGATVNEMHSELTNVEDAQARFRATASELVSRLDTSERDSTIVRQRIAALEVSVPQLTEALNTRRPAGIDPSLVTGSIDAPAQSFGKPGTPAATVPAARSTASGNASAPAVSSAPVQSMPAPLPAASAPVAATVDPTIWSKPAVTVLADVSPQPAPVARPDVIAEGAIAPVPATTDMRQPKPSPQTEAAPATAVASTAAAPAPAPAQADVRAIGIAVGSPVQPTGAFAAWQVLAAKVGVMLVGTSPLLAEDPAGGGGRVLVAGPLPDVASAAKLCLSIQQAGLNCTPMPYVGSPVLPAGAGQ